MDRIVAVDGHVTISCPVRTVDAAQRIRLRQLANMMSVPQLCTIVKPLVEGTHPVSLRLIDFGCVNYSKKMPVHNMITTATGHQVLWNLHDSYSQWLHCWTRKGFDPFRRRGRIICTVHPGNDHDDVIFETTCGQLNFMAWLVMFHVNEYIERNRVMLENDMLATHRLAKEQIKKKERRHRQHITKPTEHRVSIYAATRSVAFDGSDSEESADTTMDEIDGTSSATMVALSP